MTDGSITTSPSDTKSETQIWRYTARRARWRGGNRGETGMRIAETYRFPIHIYNTLAVYPPTTGSVGYIFMQVGEM